MAFTLVELIVSMVVLTLLMIVIAQLFSAALAVTGMRNKQMDADAQARAVFDRMAVDFSQMVKRQDVDYFFKTSNADQYNHVNPQTGNDQFAFYSQVPGYYPASTSAQQSPVSLVAWRINADSSPGGYYNQLQRFGMGLLWSSVSASGSSAIVFSSGTSGASCCGSNNVISTNWPAATDSTAVDSAYEPAGPQVFRMEYYYVLKGQTSRAGRLFTPQLSDTPWEMRPDVNGQPFHTSVNGMQDVAGITVVIAVADPKSLSLVGAKLPQLASSMAEFPQTSSTGVNTTQPGWLQTQWQSMINNPANGIPPAAASSLRIYQRTFPLPSSTATGH